MCRRPEPVESAGNDEENGIRDDHGRTGQAPGEPDNPTEDAAPIMENDRERVDAAEAEAGADDEDVFASEEAEMIVEEDDDDNPYQESDEALPDDKEEAAIRHDLMDPDNIDRRP